MPETSLPQSLLTQLDDHDRQLRDLSQSAQTQYSSIRDGSLQILDADGNVVIIVGKTDVGRYGIVIFSPDGDRQLFAAGRGLSAAPPGIVPMVVSTSAIIGGTSFRPGTISASLAEIWKGSFFSVGPDVFWAVTVFPNAGNMDFRITIQEEGGVEQTVYNETGTTVNAVRSGTFAIPSSSLIPATGTDVLGRFYLLRMLAKRNSGAASVDVALQRHPMNANFL